MYEFACHYWDGDDHISDEDADECLKDRFGEDDETRKAYLPSVVRAELCPDDIETSVFVKGRWRSVPRLSSPELLALRNRSSGIVRRACTETLHLGTLLRQSRTRDLLHVGYQSNPVYAACSLVVQPSDFVDELLDMHFDMEAQSGEATTYHGFARFASNARAIRRQYADWALAFRILIHLDRLLSLVTQPI
jgi:PRTRC genetic system protein F